MQLDFFNNVAAIAVVLLFTKIVAHRSREVQPRAQSTQRKTLAAFHVIAVLSAAVAAGASLIATDWQSATTCFRTAFRSVAWSGVAAASIILVVDVIIDAVHGARRPSMADSAASSREFPAPLR